MWNRSTRWPGSSRVYGGKTCRMVRPGPSSMWKSVRIMAHTSMRRTIFHSTMNRGERAITIDEVPLEWCFQPGVKLDFRHFADGYVATAADVERELARIGHELKPLEIAIVNTRAGSRYGHKDYVSTGCGMGYK